MARRAAQLRRSERLREIRHGLQETGNRLRSRGVIRPNGLVTELPSSKSSSTPHHTGLDYFTSDPNVSQSGPSSPYFLPDDRLYPNPHSHPSINIMSHLPPSPAFKNESYPSSPELCGQPEMHFLPIGDRLFYDSPESASEPRTPGAFSDMQGQNMHLDPTPFCGYPDDSMTF
jgi:hypothetical protein